MQRGPQTSKSLQLHEKKKERDVETIPRSEKKNVVDIGACMVMQYIKVHLHPQTSENGGKTS